MKTPVALLIAICMIFAPLSLVRAEVDVQVSAQGYNVEVCSIQARTSLDGRYTVVQTTATSGWQLGVNEVVYEYDFEQERPDRRDRFDEDAPVALVRVDGFCAELGSIQHAEDVVVTVNGLPVEADSCAVYREYIGWQNVSRNGSMGVAFPIVLTRQGGKETYEVCVQAQIGGKRVTERASLAVELRNVHQYKQEGVVRIADLAGENVDAYLVGDRIYLDHPEAARGEAKVKITFAWEDGAAPAGIVWAAQTTCEAEDKAALYLAQEHRLTDCTATCLLDSGCAEGRRRGVVFTLETRDVQYHTAAYDIVERFHVPAIDPKGICFAQSEQVLRVGECFTPTVLGVATGEPVRTCAAGELSVLPGPGTDPQVIDVSDGRSVIGVKPGVAYLTARYAMGSTVYTSASMKVTVAQDAPYYVLCRVLNVRARASASSERLGRLRRGETVRVVEIANGWARLADGSFVAAQYIGR